MTLSFSDKLFISCTGGACVSQHADTGQRAICGTWFSPSTLWVLRGQLRLAVLVSSDFIQWMVSPAHKVNDSFPVSRPFFLTLLCFSVV